MNKVPVILIILSFFIAPSIILAEPLEIQLDITKGELCQNGVTSLVKENVQKLRQKDTLIIFALANDAHYVTFAIKSEDLPVVYETITDKELTRFIVKLK